MYILRYVRTIKHWTFSITVVDLWLTCGCRLCLQEYEEKLARLQADYDAEQQSRAKLQEDIATLRSEYKSKMSEQAPTSRGSSVLKDDGKLSSKTSHVVPPLVLM